jgi:hypothetical protein
MCSYSNGREAWSRAKMLRVQVPPSAQGTRLPGAMAAQPLCKRPVIGSSPMGGSGEWGNWQPTRL